jgi:uncharacterized repeat protein (TIGR03803 family)
MFSRRRKARTISAYSKSNSNRRSFRVEELECRRLLSGYTTFSEGNFASIGLMNPDQTIVRDTAGDAFGIARSATSGGPGGVWEFTNGGTLHLVANFDTTDGVDPTGGLVMDSNGNLFGVCTSGGANGDGTVWEITAGSSTITLLASFATTDAVGPLGQIFMDSSGNIWGTAQGGISSGGNIWEYNSTNQTISDVADFTDGFNPMGGLISDGKGNLFGTTFNGGADSEGTVWEFTIGGSSITTLDSFNGGTKGGDPSGGIAIDANGNLFGTSEGDVNSSSDSNVWELPAGSGQIQTLAFFPVPNVRFFFGAAPEAPVRFDSNGDLLGTAEFGGSAAQGSVWIIPHGTTTLETLHAFTFSGGHDPDSSILLDSVGDILGTTQLGGTSDDGTVFLMIPPGVVAPTHLAFTTQPVNTDAAGDFSGNVVVSVEGKGNVVSVNDTSAVTLTIEKGPAGAILGGTTTVDAVAGVATFSGLTLNAAGTYTLKATDGALKFAISKSFSVPTDAQIVPSVQPSDVAAGAKMSSPIVMDFEDQFGNILTTSHSVMKLSIVSGPTGAKLTGNTAPATRGVATFKNLEATKAGSYTLAVSDGAATPVTLMAYNVTPAAAAKAVFLTPPTGVTIDTPFSVEVELVDKFGNVTTGDTSSITMALRTHPRNSLLGGTDTVAVSAGIADFTDLTVDTAGPYTLLATDSGTAKPVTSAKFVASA